MTRRYTKAPENIYRQARKEAGKWNEKFLTIRGAAEELPGISEESLKKYELDKVTPPNDVSGVSKTKSWEITKIDSERVPISVAGTEIRPVDEKAVMRLIKASKGQIEIPGVTYKETYNISVRA